MTISIEAIERAATEHCETEPVQHIGAVQPFAAMLVLDPEDLAIVQASENTLIHLGAPPQELLGKRLESLLTPRSYEAILKVLSTNPRKPPQERVVLRDSEHHLVANIHVNSRVLILEFERPARLPYESNTLSLSNARSAVEHFADFDSPKALCDFAAAEVRKLTEHDRVMVYRFDSDGHGHVISESKDETKDLEPFLGLHFPNSDVPALVRDLYTRTRFRMLTNADEEPVPLVPQECPLTDGPLDMTYCVSRGQSRICRVYYQNMGVKATLIGSIVVNKKLWGLVSCHHYSPKVVEPEIRQIFALLNEALSMQIKALETRDSERGLAVIQQFVSRFTASKAISWQETLLTQHEMLLEAFSADGMAIVSSDGIWAHLSPDETCMRHLDRHIRDKADKNGLFSTENLEQAYGSDALNYSEFAGVLGMVLSDRDTLLLFRKPETETVTWAGNPQPIIHEEQDRIVLHPRNSFNLWREKIQGRAVPWSDGDHRLARRWRTSLIEIVLRAHSLREVIIKQDLLRVRRAVEIAENPIFLETPTGKVTLVNEGFERLFGYTHEELTAAGGIESIFPGLPVAESRSVAKEIAVTAQDGRPLQVAFTREPIHTEAGEMLGYVTIATDLTARIKEEGERLRMERQLHEKDKLEKLGKLAGGVAHDFNNILVGILGNVEMALLKASGEDPLRKRLRSIEAAAQRASQLATQMLTYTGRRTVKQSIVNLSEIPREIEGLLSASLPPGVHLRMELAPYDVTVDVDAGQIHQILMNLIINASEALKGESGAVEILTGALPVPPQPHGEVFPSSVIPEGAYGFVSVKDTGIGIKASALSQIFDPFFSSKGQSRGLGLSTVLGIVRSHGGWIAIESEPGVGSTFTVLLPLTQRGRLAPGEDSERQKPPEKHNLRTLVIDDEEVVRETLRELLEHLEHDVVLADGGVAGLEVYEAQPKGFSLVILDLTMPGMDGHEVYETIRAINPTQPVLFVSGFARVGLHLPTEEASYVDFVQKPFRLSELAKRVRALLETDKPE